MKTTKKGDKAMVQVETFEVTEIDAETGAIESNEESIALIGKLGLHGQQALLSPDKTERSPYRQMTRDERLIYGALFPSRTAVESYRLSPIPLRVLQIVAHAKSLGTFTRIEVWDEPAAEVKDPVLVGIGHPAAQWEPGLVFILARWGAALAPLAELAKVALTKRRERARTMLADIRAKVDAALATIDTATLDRVASDPTFFFNGAE